MEYYMDDENWRVSSSSNNAYNSTKSSSSSSSSLPRSIVSQKCPSSKSTTSRTSLYKTSSLNTPLPRSSSQRSPFTKIPQLPRSSSQKCANFGRKCSSLAKEQKAKFYIVKRCITMLVSWNKHGDS